jgi:hypothetical protein
MKPRIPDHLKHAKPRDRRAYVRYCRARCHDCGVTTAPRFRFDRKMDATWEWYVVRHDVWSEAGMSDGFLCVGCLEKRIRRRFGPADFLDNPDVLDTPRLSARRRVNVR